MVDYQNIETDKVIVDQLHIETDKIIDYWNVEIGKGMIV
jgi:hypothetical protein